MNQYFMHNGKLKEIPTREGMIGHIDAIFELLEAERDRGRRLRGELDRPADEKLMEAHAKIKELEEENRRIRQKSLYCFSESEEERMKKTFSEHRKECGGRVYHYEVTPTGLGTEVEFVCGCGFRATISDDF